MSACCVEIPKVCKRPLFSDENAKSLMPSAGAIAKLSSIDALAHKPAVVCALLSLTDPII
jgi:hypothetical protein